MSNVIKLLYSVSGQFKTPFDNSDIMRDIDRITESKVQHHLGSYDIFDAYLNFIYDTDTDPFVFRTRSYMNDSERQDADDYIEDVYFDHRVYVEVHFHSKLDLNRFKIMNEEMHPYFNGDVEIRINL